jgi:hypothetical protein
MIPRDLQVASLNVRDMAKRLTVQANEACALLSHIYSIIFLCTTQQLSRGGRGFTSTSMQALGLQ